VYNRTVNNIRLDAHPLEVVFALPDVIAGGAYWDSALFLDRCAALRISGALL
jgi:hypothetical protein